MSNRQQIRWEGCRKFWRPALFWVCTWGKLEKHFFDFILPHPPLPIWRQNLKKKKIFLSSFWHFALDRSEVQYLLWAFYRYFDWCWWLGWGRGLSFTTILLQNHPWCRVSKKRCWAISHVVFCRWPAVPWLSIVDVGISSLAKIILSCKEITKGWILYLFSLSALPPK